MVIFSLIGLIVPPVKDCPDYYFRVSKDECANYFGQIKTLVGSQGETSLVFLIIGMVIGFIVAIYCAVLDVIKRGVKQ